MTGDLADINEHHILNWLSLGWAVTPGPNLATICFCTWTFTGIQPWSFIYISLLLSYKNGQCMAHKQKMFRV